MTQPQVTLSTRHIDSLIVLLLFFNLPVDMVNGILLKSGIVLPMSVSQLYKLSILVLILFRLVFFPGVSIFIISVAYIFLFFSSLIQAISEEEYNFLLDDFIKISKYMTPFIAFFYFQGLFRKGMTPKFEKYFFYWIYFSYAVLAANILVSLVGLGYPMYDAGNIGTRGFFFAGNEISAILLILCAVIAYQIWNIYHNKWLYVAFLVFNVFLSILITSKTSVLGIFIIFSVIAFNPKDFKINVKTVFMILLSILVLIPTVVYFAYKLILSSTIMIRLTYFWEKLDFWTFIFSSRNIFVEKMWAYYVKDYSIVQKIIGAGQTYYESFLGTIVEIDLLDVFFAYGILGAMVFCFAIALLIATAYSLKKKSYWHPYARLSYTMILILTIISMFSGHIYSSGIGGFYIGFIFAIMYYKQTSNA